VGPAPDPDGVRLIGSDGAGEGRVGDAVADGVVRGPLVGDALAGAAEVDAGGVVEDGAGDAQTSSITSCGGRAWVDPVSPEPHTQPSRSPSPTLVEAAPVEDHVHPAPPSLRQ
jgi:hypothetical protein